MPQSKRRSMTWCTFEFYCSWNHVASWSRPERCRGSCSPKHCPRWRRLPVVQEQENPGAAMARSVLRSRKEQSHGDDED